MATYCTHLIIIQCIVRAITDDSPIRDVINHLYLCPPSDHKKALMIKVTPGNVLKVFSCMEHMKPSTLQAPQGKPGVTIFGALCWFDRGQNVYKVKVTLRNCSSLMYKCCKRKE